MLNLMPPEVPSPLAIKLLKPGLLGSWLAKRFHVWQMDMLSPSDLARFAGNRSIHFWDKHIIWLWQLGLLRADLVASNHKLKEIGLIELGKDEQGEYLYADERQPKQRPTGWDGSITTLPPFPKDIKLLFHPFRYYVLYYINRVLRPMNIAPILMLNPEQYMSGHSYCISNFKRFSASKDFLEDIGRSNDITALAVASEPHTFERIFGIITYKDGLKEETLNTLIVEHRTDVYETYKEIGIARLEEVRNKICQDAELLEPNSSVHTLLRLMDGEERLKLKGDLGGAVHMLTMAEMLRRSAEGAFDTTLPEEDEIGIRRMPRHSKEFLYGSNRVLDEDRNVVNEFLRFLDLDYGVRTRWYVEGDTEYGAIRRIIGIFGATWVQVINLRGHFIEKRNHAFTGTLSNDIEAGIFSFVSIDEEDGKSNALDRIRMVKEAAKKDTMFGGFYISQPDFELHNFDLPELEEVLWEVAGERGAAANEQTVLHDAIVNTKSAKALFREAERAIPALVGYGKGQEWGRRLMDYALEHNEKPDGTLRPIIEAVQTALRIRLTNYQWQREEFRVDPDSGDLIECSNYKAES
jgi:hypothetical protein